MRFDTGSTFSEQLVGARSVKLLYLLVIPHPKRMGYKGDMVELDLQDGRLTTLIHMAQVRVRHQLESYISEAQEFIPLRGLGQVHG